MCVCVQDILDFDNFFTGYKDKSIERGIRAINTMTFTSRDKVWFSKSQVNMDGEDLEDTRPGYELKYKISM